MNILYDKNPDKNLDEFRKALIQRVKENRKNGIDDFSGIVFPCDIAWVDKIILYNEEVISNLPDDCTQIGKEIRVEHGFLLGKEVEFLKWNKKVKEFKEANFIDVQFSGEANFIDVQFSGVANFVNAQFSGLAYFSDAQFSGEAYFGNAQFSGEAYFGNAQFSGDAYFWNTKFSGEADFSHAKFSEKAYFSDVQFSGGVNFWNVKFSGEAYFSSAKFSGLANFSDAQFSGLANFSDAQFSGEADFWNAKFLGDKTYFANLKTSPKTSFYFSLCTFGDDALDLILFEDISESVPMKFERLVIGSEHIKFNKVNLTQATFAHTDLRRFEFTDITWGSIKEKGFNRKIIQDEETGKTEAVERLYRQLKQSYEDNREYVLAGEFHFSEKSLQQHRAYQNKNYGQWFWLATYRWLSGYGERLLPSASWLLLLTFLVMPLVYLGTGIRLKDKDAVSDFYILEWDRWRETEELTEIRKENRAKPNTVLADAACLPYALKKDSFNVHWYPHRCQYDEKRNILRSIGYWQGEWDAYGKAFGHSFKVILPFQERMHVSYSFLGALATGIHTILAPLLFFLFSAALRQRTRR